MGGLIGITREDLGALVEMAVQRALGVHEKRAKQKSKGDWITKEEAEHELKCSYSTLYRKVIEGHIVVNDETPTHGKPKLYSLKSINDHKAGLR